ncbi:MAG: FKBP-type peptidyl-prolyl cis-trans isomerase [Bacteroidales bacterium]
MNFSIKRNFILLFAFIAIVTGFSSCLNTEDPFEQYRSWYVQNENYFSKLQKSGTYEVDSIPLNEGGGVILKKVLKEGTGTVNPYFNSNVKVYYTGKRLKDGSDAIEDMIEFDSTYKITNVPGSNPPVALDEEGLKEYNNPATFTLNKNIIRGWTYALQHMVVGEKAEIVIPWILAYGITGKGSIPPYSTLIFEIELVEIINK